VLSACRIFSEGLEFVENFLERVESNRTPRKKKKKKQRRGKKKTTQRKKEVRFGQALPGFLIIAHHLCGFLV